MQTSSVIKDTIMEHLRINNMLSEKQYGFISGRSTVLQLLTVLEKWLLTLDKGGMIDVIYCDFMKAFDKVPHKRLIKKLTAYGIEGNLLNWIQSFLTGRQQQVVINGIISKPTDVTSGIPQGSVLGPLLFIIYINDLPDVISSGSEIFLFADDTKLFRSIFNPKDCDTLQNDINSMCSWTDNSLLRFHPDKCKSMRISTRKTSPHTYTMEFNNHTLAHSSSEKDIGVIIDDKLCFDEHINGKISKSNQIMGLIRRTFDYLDKENFKHLYKSLVRPHIEYANVVWAPYLKKHINAIENVQRRATKLVPGMRNLPYHVRLQKLKLPTLVFRRLRGDMIELYKILSNKYDQVTADLIERQDTNSITRGHSLKIKKIRPRLNIRKFSFPLRCTDQWNKLPESVISAPSVNSFKARLDKLWESHPLRYNYDCEPICNIYTPESL
jgi:hypothetical protein